MKKIKVRTYSLITRGKTNWLFLSLAATFAFFGYSFVAEASVMTSFDSLANNQVVRTSTVSPDNAICEKIFGSRNLTKGLNIFFVGVGYSENQIECNGDCSLDNYDTVLENDIYRFLYNNESLKGYGLLTIEPFRSYRDYVNIYMLKTPIICDYQTDPYCSWTSVIDSVVNNCPAYKPNMPIHTIYGYDDPVTYGLGGGNQGHSGNHRKGQHEYDDVVSVFIHEIGHNFGLRDLYSQAYWATPNYTMQDTYGIPNCDNTAGCPKWCAGQPEPPYTVSCTNYISEQDCNLHAQEFCIWLDQPDPYFNSRCIANMDFQNRNIGINCALSTGCYLGCSGAGYRPVPENNFADRFSQRIDDAGKKHIYEPISERFVSDIFKCCYANSCTGYNKAYCSDFSQRYPEYASCNVCSKPSTEPKSSKNIIDGRN